MAVSTQPLISVIVPVYNVERYLDQCVESLIGQTYERLEIILVDDGSTDSSGEQCNAWANRDNRIRAVRQCNAGLAAARNTGLDLAKGEYIGFVDSDDYVLPDMFGTLLHNLQESDADLSIISYERENPDGSTYCNAFPDKKIVMTSQEAFAYVNQHGYFYVTAWDKLAKKELFDNLRYPLDAVYAEDSPVTYQLLDKADRIVYDSTPLYRYRMSENSQSMASPTNSHNPPEPCSTWCEPNIRMLKHMPHMGISNPLSVPAIASCSRINASNGRNSNGMRVRNCANCCQWWNARESLGKVNCCNGNSWPPLRRCTA